MRIPGIGSKQGSHLSSKKINQYVVFEDSTLPGNSYNELQQFKEEIALIAKKAGVKVSIYNAKKDLPNVHSMQNGEFFSSNVGVRILKKKKPQTSFLVNYSGSNGNLTKSFLNRFLAQLQINLDILKYKNELVNKAIFSIIDGKTKLIQRQQQITKLVKTLLKNV